MGVEMPRNRMLAQIEEELSFAQSALAFWRDQATILADTQFKDSARRQVKFREQEIKQLLDAHHALEEERDP